MEIKLSEKYTIHIIKNVNYQKEQLIKEIYYNNQISKQTFEISLHDRPGIQSDFIITTKSFSDLKNNIFEKFCEIYNLDIDTTPHFLKCWCYIANPGDKNTLYHTHTKNDALYLKNQYTWVFYVKIPKVLVGDEGKIVFKTEDDVEHKFLPEEGDLIFFDADLNHKPEPCINTETERIALAGNYCLLDLEKDIKKRKQTII